MIGFFHSLLYYKSMAYTYLIEKFHMQMKRIIIQDDLDIKGDFVGNIHNIIEYSRKNNFKLVFVKQVMRAPVIINSINTLDSIQIEKLYKATVEEYSNNRKPINMHHLSCCSEVHTLSSRKCC